MESTYLINPFGAIGAIALLLASAHAGAAVLKVNLGPSGLPTETGFTNWTTADNTTPLATTVNGIGLSVAITTANPAGTIRSLNRTDTYNGPLDNLTQTWWGVRASTTGTGGQFAIVMSNLAAGDYEWTSWHHDHSDQRGLMTIAVSVNGGTSFTNMLTNFAIVNGNHANAPNPATFDFTANGTQDVLVRFTNTSLNGAGSSGTFALLNGFQIVPEPSTALLGGIGMLALLRRRR